MDSGGLETGEDETGTGETDATETDEPALDADEDGYLADEDCDDSDSGVNPGAVETCDGVDNDCDGDIDEDTHHTFWVDADGDGYGDESAASVESCEAPVGYTSYGGDCDDASPTHHPGASEADCTDPEDYNCDGSVGYADGDGDGHAACEDCNDADAAVNPGESESCNDVDDDCDGTIDEDATDTSTWYGDADGDGYGGTQFQEDACTQPPGYVASPDDCNDLDATSHPAASEVCDGGDNDCDGTVDEGVGLTFYADTDGDGYGDSAAATTECAQPPGHSSNGDDCDDSNPSAHPGGVEVCDAVDNDCDGTVDNDAVNASAWYADADGDGYGASGASLLSCDVVSGSVTNDADCNDADPGVNPGAAELCNSVDDDCDGVVDDSPLDADSWYLDGDGDGYGAGAVAAVACDGPSGTTADNTDCDDTTAGRNPGLAEACDDFDVDEDCDGLSDDLDPEGASGKAPWYVDSDADGFGDQGDAGVDYCDPPSGTASNGTDCNDSEGAIHPSATEICDGSNTDEDCDGLADDLDPEGAEGRTAWYPDLDTDGYGDVLDSGTLWCIPPSGVVTDNTDCDDNSTGVNPGAAEVCDVADTDEDCTGTADDTDSGATGQTLWYTDADSDGYGSNADTGTSLCNAPANTVSVQGDCSDSDASVYPDSSGFCAVGSSCEAILASGVGVSSGVYSVDPDGPTGSASAYDVYCDQSMAGGDWTLLLSANGPSTYWGNNSANWSSAGTDTPPSSLQDADYHGAAYGALVTDEIRICFQDNAHCYTFSHSQGRTLQSFFVDGVSHVEYSQGSNGISDAGSSSSRDAYLNGLGVSAQSVNCTWLGINDTQSISAIGLLGDWNGGCTGGGFAYHDDLAIGVGLQSCYDQNSCSNGGSGHAAGRTRGLNGTDDSGVHGPWFVFGR